AQEGASQMCRSSSLILLFFLCLVAVPGCSGNKEKDPHLLPIPRDVVDEAQQAGRDAASLPAADEDYFHDMDGGVPLTSSQVVGRNNWIVWTAGNDRLWDLLSLKSAGVFDLLKTISSHPYPQD